MCMPKYDKIWDVGRYIFIILGVLCTVYRHDDYWLSS